MPPENSSPAPQPAPQPVPQTPPVPPPTPASAPQPAPQAPINAAPNPDLPQIRTFQGDVASALHIQKESVESIRAKELARAELLRKAAASSAQQRDTNAPPGGIWPNASPLKQVVGAFSPLDNTPAPVPMPEPAVSDEEKSARWKSVGLFLGSIILLAAGGYVGWITYHSYQAKVAVPVVIAPQNRFLSVVATSNLDATALTREDLIALTAADRAKPLADGNVSHLELRKGNAETSPLLNSTDFFLKTRAKMPGSLVRAFDPLFMLGTLGHASGTPASTFILIKLDSFENAFAGMLDWESTLAEDMLPFFNSELPSLPQPAVWKDITIRNKDARILPDADGKTVLTYSFYNQNLLIITTDEGSLRTLIAELDAEALKR